MTKPTESQIEAAALELATKLAARLPLAYAAACKKYAKHYDELPNQDDFWAWLEGYDWSEQIHIDTLARLSEALGDSQPVARVTGTAPKGGDVDWLMPEGRSVVAGDLLYASPQRAEPASSHPVFAYLLGEAPLLGKHFGDGIPVGEHGRFWWRKHLQAALAAHPSTDQNHSG